MKKRILSMVAVLAMVFSMMPQAFAEDAALALKTVMNISNQINVSDTMQLGENVALSKTFKGLSTINEFVTTSENDFIEWKLDFGDSGLTDGANKMIVANVRARAEGQIVVTRPVQATDAEGTTEITIATINVKPRTSEMEKTNYDGVSVISAGAKINSAAYGNANLKGEQIIRVSFVGDEVDFCRLYELQFVGHNTDTNYQYGNDAYSWSDATKSGQIAAWKSNDAYACFVEFFWNTRNSLQDVRVIVGHGATYQNMKIQVRLDHPDGEIVGEHLLKNENGSNWAGQDITFPLTKHVTGAHLVYFTLDRNDYNGTDDPYCVSNPATCDFKNFQFKAVADVAEDTSDDFVVNTTYQSHHLGAGNAPVEKQYMNTLVRFKKSATTAEKVMLVAALYDENNKLISVNTQMHDVVDDYNAVEVETKWQDAKNAGAGDYTWKAFIWDGTTLSPVAGTAKNLGTVTIAEEVVEEE